MGENVYIRDLIDFDVTVSTSRGKSKLEYKFQDKENSEDIFSFGSALEDFISVVFVHDRNIVKIVERERVEGEARLLDSTVGRVVPLLLVASARAESELEASVEKLFDEGG
ncbi:hypothetical protein Tco_1538164 [Tanacetum coccineum]